MKTFKKTVSVYTIILLSFTSIIAANAINFSYAGQYAHYIYSDNNTSKTYTTRAKLNGVGAKACVGVKNSEYFCNIVVDDDGFATMSMKIFAPHVHGYSTSTGTPNNWE